MPFEIAVVIALASIIVLQIILLNKPRHVEYRENYVMDKCPKCKVREQEQEAEKKRAEAKQVAELERYLDEYNAVEECILKGDIPEYDFFAENGLFRSREHKICVPVDAIESIDVIDSGSRPTFSMQHPGYGDLRPRKHLARIRITMKSGVRKFVTCWPPEVDFVLQGMQDAWANGLKGDNDAS